MRKESFSSLRQPIRFTLYYFMSVTALSFVGTLWLHQEYWGYPLEPPGLLEAAKTITEVDQLIPVKTSDCDTPKQCKFEVDPSQSISTHYDPRDEYPSERLLLYLQDTGKLPSSFDRELQEGVDLYAPMLESPIIATPEEGYTNHTLEGVIMIGRTASRQQRVFISARGSQVSDDHYPHYEAIFAMGQNDKTVQYLEGQRFFFDIAGLEFLEGPWVIFFMTGVLVLIFGCVPMTIFIIVDTLRMCLRSLNGYLKSRLDKPN